MTWYGLLVYLHILSALTFALAHGVVVAVSFRLAAESKIERIRALLDAAAIMRPTLHISIHGIVVTGVILGFMGSWWRMVWIWLSLALLVAITIWMGHYSGKYYEALRKAVGAVPGKGSGDQSPADPAISKEVASIIASTNPRRLLLFGYGAIVAILWLMVAKPF